jgi:hypothetical protein
MKTITLTIILAASIAILRDIAGENVDHGNPSPLHPVTAWPWESPANSYTPKP